MKRSAFAYCIIICSLLGCSMNQIAVKSAAPLLDEASSSVETEKNWNFVKDSLPTNLMMMEGMLSIDPSNLKLLKNLVKGYSAYAFGVSETLYLSEMWGETEITTDLDSAVDYYGRALRHGLHYLNLKGIKTDHLMAAQDLDEMKKLLSKISADKDSREVIFFLAQSWGGLVNLQRGNIALLSTIGIMKNMIDTVCGIDPNFQFGACDIFSAVYETSRPKTLGGNPEKGVKIFKQTMEARPDNLLVQIAYLQYSVIPSGDEAEYKRIKTNLLLSEKQFKNLKLIIPGQAVEDVFHQTDDRISILNSIALKRFEIMKKYEKKFF
ncbi:MAG: TRAP transporter TatT component family protein [Bacteriovoracaceae bacterium]